MKILMRSTVFSRAALAGLFSLMLAFGGVFFGITASVHAVTAGEVGTDETKLKQFVEAAVDEYYVEFLLKEHCDLTKLDLGPTLTAALSTNLQAYGISDLSPASIQTLSTERVKELVRFFKSDLIQDFLPENFDMWGGCRPFPGTDSFRSAFGSGEGDWRKDPIYLFVLQYEAKGTSPRQAIVFHGLGKDREGFKDGLADSPAPGARMILDLTEMAADEPVPPRTEKGFVDYCFDDPTTDDDNLPDDGDPLTASGDSWKTSYVVDPFEYLEVDSPNAPSNYPRVLFGSGIYPKTGTGPEGCEIYGEEPPTTTPPPAGGGDSGGGGCAIAAGSDGTSQGVALNLLLIASALFFTVSLAGRAGGRWNGIRS